MKGKVVQSCPPLCNPIDYTVHGILQARILEWVGFPFSRGSSQPRYRTQVSHMAGGFFTSWPTREALKRHVHILETVSVTLFGKISSGHRTGKGHFSFQFQRKAMPKNVQTIAQLCSFHILVKRKLLSPVQLFATPWTIQSMEFSRPESWSG